MSKFPHLTSELVEERIRTVDMLRETTRQLREAALKAYEAGTFPYRPVYDVRADYQYWKQKADELQAKKAAES